MTPDQIMWVITVPAEWITSAGLGVRRAAIRAGIITSLGSDALWLLPEMEAVSLYAKKTAAMGAVHGTSFAVIDAGETHSSIFMVVKEHKAGKTMLGRAFHKVLLKAQSSSIDKVRNLSVFVLVLRNT